MLQLSLSGEPLLISHTTKKPKQIEALKPTRKQGIVYMTQDGSLFTEPKLTKEYISELSESNIYARGVLNKLQWMLFTGEPDIEIRDPSNTIVPAGSPGKPTLYNDVKTMLDNPDVDLWGALQQALHDSFWWGNCILNPVWEYVGNVYTLTNLKRLAPESFTYEPEEGEVYNPLLKGITLKQGKPEYWYVDDEGVSRKLTYYHSIQPPNSTRLGGTPMIQPMLLTIGYLNQAWKAVSQTTNRAGAPSLFLRITDGDEDTFAYCREMLKHWGKNTSFPIPENVEIVDPHIKEPANTHEAIRMLQNLLIDYFSPVSMLQGAENSGALFDNSTHKSALIMAFIDGMHSWLEDGFEKLLQTYLIANRYDGYSIRVKLPSPDIDKTEADQRWVEVLSRSPVPIVTTNELRRFVPDADELDEAGLAALRAEMAPAPAPAMPTEDELPVEIVGNAASDITQDEQEAITDISQSVQETKQNVIELFRKAGYINA